MRSTYSLPASGQYASLTRRPVAEARVHRSAHIALCNMNINGRGRGRDMHIKCIKRKTIKKKDGVDNVTDGPYQHHHSAIPTPALWQLFLLGEVHLQLLPCTIPQMWYLFFSTILSSLQSWWHPLEYYPILSLYIIYNVSIKDGGFAFVHDCATNSIATPGHDMLENVKGWYLSSSLWNILNPTTGNGNRYRCTIPELMLYTMWRRSRATSCCEHNRWWCCVYWPIPNGRRRKCQGELVSHLQIP